MKDFFYTYDEHGVKNYNNLPLLVIAFLAFFVIIYFAGKLLLSFEVTAPDENVRNLGDAIWLTYMAASTIGFGDYYPVTLGGRIIIGSMFVVGAVMLGIILGLVHNMMMGWLDTNVKNRELRTDLTNLQKHNESLAIVVGDLREELKNLYKHNEDIMEHNKLIEGKIDDMVAQIKHDGVK